MSSSEESNNFYKTNKDKIKVLTFQTREVLGILLEKGEYLADINLSRESREYAKDIEQLNGFNPIWCFSPIGLQTLFLNKFVMEDFLNGELFDRFRCEMSLPSGEALNNLVLLELELNCKDIRVGLTHNSYIGAVVIPRLGVNDLVAHYSLEYTDGHDSKYFYPDIKIDKIYGKNNLFITNFSCRKDAKLPRSADSKQITLYRGCNTHELDSIITREFSEITWWSTDARDAGHYYEGGCIKLRLLEEPTEKMEYLQDSNGIPINYTFGSAEMECPKDSTWYSISNKYIKEYSAELCEVEPEYYDWELEEMKEDTDNMKIF